MVGGLSKIELLNFLGVGVGGVGPVFLVMGTNVISPISTPALFSVFTLCGCLFALITFSCIAIATLADKKGKHATVERALFGSAVVSVIFLSVFVVTTGGPFTSPFSYHYLYIPVVTGLCLGRGALKMACFGCGASFLIAALADRLWLSQLPAMKDANTLIASSSSYFFSYIVIFYLQLVITYVLAKHTMVAEDAATSS